MTTSTATKTPSSVLEVLSMLGIQIAAHGPKEIAAHCPFHSDRHPSFSINAHSGLWVCFQCGERGALEQLISKVGKGVEATTFLREVKQSKVGKYEPTQTKEEEAPFAPLVFARYESFKSPPRNVYEDRYISSAMIDRYGVKWNKGWILPIWDPQPQGSPADLWGWQFKQLSFVRNYPTGIHKSQTLFGLREFSSGCAILVESPLDVVRLASAGIEGGLATFGAMVSSAQLKLLVERAESVLLALDNDLEGKKQAKKITHYLTRFLPTEVLRYRTDAKDVGELNDGELAKVFSDF